MTAQSLSHQRMELVIFGPHGFYSQGLIHTIIRVQDPCQTTAQTFKLFFDSSITAGSLLPHVRPVDPPTESV